MVETDQKVMPQGTLLKTLQNSMLSRCSTPRGDQEKFVFDTPMHQLV